MNTLYLTHPLNGILMVIIPIGVGVYLVSKFKQSWVLWWVGAITFILSQVAHIPFNLLILSPLIDNTTNLTSSVVQKILVSSILLGLSAGIFEELARYIAFRWWQTDARSWAKAIIFGAGHGGIEAILLGLLVLYTFIQMITLRNVDLLTILPQNYVSLVEQQVQAYWSIPWHLSLFGALERIFVIPFHISAAVLVLQAFKRHHIRWLILAIIWHTAVDAIGISAARLWGVYAAEGVIGFIAILSMGIILAFREPYVNLTSEPLPIKEPVSFEGMMTPEVTKDALERTRFS